MGTFVSTTFLVLPKLSKKIIKSDVDVKIRIPSARPASEFWVCVEMWDCYLSNGLRPKAN